jgi:hypothetical protein
VALSFLGVDTQSHAFSIGACKWSVDRFSPTHPKIRFSPTHPKIRFSPTHPKIRFSPTHPKIVTMLLFYQVATRLSPTTCWQIIELQDDNKLLEQLVTRSVNIIVLFVETPRKFITAKLSICKPGSSSVLIICNK